VCRDGSDVKGPTRRGMRDLSHASEAIIYLDGIA